MISKSFAVRLAAVSLTGIWLAFSQQQAPPPDLNVIKIADDLHILEGSGGNTAVYQTDEGVILVDDKFAQNVPQILAKVRGLTDKPIRYVLNTHLHGDHTGGNAELMKMPGVETFAYQAARDMMIEQKLPGVPRIAFGDRGSVTLGGKTVEAYYFGRGHTRGDMFYYFPARKTVHTGDLFVRTSPNIDYRSGASVKAWPATLNAALKQFDAVEVVIPGHGALGKKSDVAAWIKSFENVQAQVRALQKKKVAKDQAYKQIKLEGLTDFAPSSFFERSFPGMWDELAAK